MNRPNWLRHLNPLHFEVKYLKGAVWGNLLLAALFLLLSGFLQFWLKPVLGGIVSDSMRHEAKINRSDIPKQYGEVMAHQDRAMGRFFTEMARVSSNFAAVCGLFSIACAYNAFYFGKAYRLVRSQESAGVSRDLE